MTAMSDLHYHSLSSGGQTLTHRHPGGWRAHWGKDSPHHTGHDRGAYASHPGAAPRGTAGRTESGLKAGT